MLTDTSWKELRQLQLYIQLFNIAGALPIYAFKVLCMSLSVSNGCFAIKMISEHAVMAIFGGFISITASAV